MSPQSLQNRLVLASTMWREATEEPLPKLPPGDPAEQIEKFELRLVDLLWRDATPENAREVAEKTWDLVDDRPDDDPVKQHVIGCHEALAKLAAGQPE
jgi:hypothetical protein